MDTELRSFVTDEAANDEPACLPDAPNRDAELTGASNGYYAAHGEVAASHEMARIAMACDEAMMRRAIGVAAKAAGWTNPNPLVGAVVVKDGRVIGEGCHERYGQAHAERNALAACVEDPRDATLYVTLEPCCHQGKQPPCTDAVIAAGIARVVVGSRDPNPLVHGKGNALLRAAGIRVDEDVLRAECDALNPVFFHFIQTDRPYVVAKWAMTLDGKIATCTGDARWVSGSESRADCHELRHRLAAIMVGIGTVLADDPSLTARRQVRDAALESKSPDENSLVLGGTDPQSQTGRGSIAGGADPQSQTGRGSIAGGTDPQSQTGRGSITGGADPQSQTGLGSPAGEADVRLREAGSFLTSELESESQDLSASHLRDIPSNQPLRVVVDSRLRIPLDCQLVRTAEEVPVLVATALPESDERAQQLRALGVDVLSVPRADGKVDLKALMAELGARGVDSVLAEGGGGIHESLLAAGLVDELVVYLAPKVCGGADAKTPVEGSGVQLMADAFCFGAPQVERLGDDLKLAYSKSGCLAPKASDSNESAGDSPCSRA